MRLYQIGREYETLFSMMDEVVDPETGEITSVKDYDAFKRLLDGLDAEEAEKLENCGAYLKCLLAEADALKTEEASLASRRRVKENKASNLRRYLSDYMTAAGKAKFESPKVVLSFRKSEAVKITDDEKAIEYARANPELLRVKEEINASELKKQLKSGLLVNFAVIEAKMNLQVK